MGKKFSNGVQMAHIHCISQLIQYASGKILSRGQVDVTGISIQSHLMSVFRKFYGRYYDLIYNYKLRHFSNQ
jgi:hypothetical protein